MPIFRSVESALRFAMRVSAEDGLRSNFLLSGHTGHGQITTEERRAQAAMILAMVDRLPEGQRLAVYVSLARFSGRTKSEMHATCGDLARLIQVRERSTLPAQTSAVLWCCRARYVSVRSLAARHGLTKHAAETLIRDTADQVESLRYRAFGALEETMRVKPGLLE